MENKRSCGIRGTDRKPELITDNNPQPDNPTTRQRQQHNSMYASETRTAQESAFKPPTPDKNALAKPIKPPKSRNNQATGRAILYQEGDFAHLHKQFQAQHRHFHPPKTKTPSRNALKPPKQAVSPKSGGRNCHGRVKTSRGVWEKPRNCGIRGTDRKPELITDNTPNPAAQQPDKGNSTTPCTPAKHEHHKNQHSNRHPPPLTRLHSPHTPIPSLLQAQVSPRLSGT